MASVGLIACYAAAHSHTIKYIFMGNSKYIAFYAIASIPSLLASEYPLVSTFKILEILALLLAITVVHANPDPTASIKSLLNMLMWWYLVTTVSIWVQLAIFGYESQHVLVQETPYINFMLTSKYPALVGNAVGFLAAVASLFSLYLIFAQCKSLWHKTGVFVFGLVPSMLALVCSYTRSILVFFILIVLLFATLNRRRVFAGVIAVCVLVAVISPGLNDMVLSHLQRGKTQAELEDMSGRTRFWGQIMDRSVLSLMIGNGFGTGFLPSSYEMPHVKQYDKRRVMTGMNAHNSFFEILASAGVFAATLWLFLMFRLTALLVRMRRLAGKVQTELARHNFVLCIFALSFLRSTMNTTFVCVDYFFPILVLTAKYADIQYAEFKIRYEKQLVAVSQNT